MADKEPFGISEQLEKDHFADPGNMVGDLISRQAAIDALEKVADMFPWRVPGNRDTYDRYNEAWNDAIGRAEMEIENMTSAQPKFDEWCDDCKEYDRERHSCPRWNRVIRETVDDMEAAQPGWIPVAERLPERGKDVLVTRDYDGRADHIKSCRYVEVASCYGEDDDVSWNSYSDEYKMTPKNHRVLAWMPLPTPYREGDANDT